MDASMLDLDDMRRRLAVVMADLLLMPRYMSGSPKHTSLVNKCSWLRRTIERREAEARYLVAAPELKAD
jgi:hypothetical protein